MSEGVCLTCTVLGCQGVQYNPTTREFYCPVFNKVWTTDNQTIRVYTPNTVTSTKEVQNE